MISCTVRLVTICFFIFPNNVTGKVTSHPAQIRQLRGTHACPLLLLPSGPDRVYRGALHETRPSTLSKMHFLPGTDPQQGIQSCYGGLQVQGTASSPLSATLVLYNQKYKKSIFQINFPFYAIKKSRVHRLKNHFISIFQG